MKIAHNTPEQLVLKSVPWFLVITLSILLLVAVAFGMNALSTGALVPAFFYSIVAPLVIAALLVLFARRDDLILDRHHNLLELRHSTLRGRTRVQHKLEHLQEAELQSSKLRKENKTYYRVALVLNGGMDAGTHPITSSYTGGNGSKRAVDAINAWLAQDVDSGRQQA